MIAWSDMRVGKSRISCPGCGRGTSDKTCGVLNVSEKGVAHCFRCDYVEHRDGECFAGDYGRNSAQHDAHHEILAPWALKLWDECEPLHSVGLKYLQARQCVVPPRDGDLRYHVGLKHLPSGYVGPALVGLITDPTTGGPRSLHRTWITAHGEKATKPGRMYLKNHGKVGAVRLWPSESVATALAIAEGIETALSLAHAFQPVWAAVDAGNLAMFPVLDGIEALTIAADHDIAGIKAAETCARRWADAGREVRIVMAEGYKQDLNDLAVAA